jgi:hypothetical protein
MAIKQVQLRSISYATLANAQAAIQTTLPANYNGPYQTIYYNNSSAGVAPQNQPGATTQVFEDATANTTPFDGQGEHWIFDAANDQTHGYPTVYVLQIGNGAVNVANLGMPTLACGDVNLNIPGGADGDLVAGTVDSGFTIASYNPTNYATGTDTYSANVNIPPGYNNSDDGTLNCVIQGVTITTTQAPTTYDCSVAGPTIANGNAGDTILPAAVTWLVAPANSDYIITPSVYTYNDDGDGTTTYQISEISPPSGYSNFGGVDISCDFNGDIAATAATTNATAATTAPTNATNATLGAFTCSTETLTIANGVIGEQITAADFSTTGTATFASIIPTTYQAGTTSYTLTVNIPVGYLNSGTIDCDVSVTGGLATASISMSDTSAITIAPLGTPYQAKTVTITGATSNFDVDTHILYDSSAAWLTASTNSFGIDGGQLRFQATENNTGSEREVNVTLRHPDNVNVTATTFKITQTSGNTAPTGDDITKSQVWSASPSNVNINFLDFASTAWSGLSVTDADGDDLSVIITDISGLTLEGNVSVLIDNSSGTPSNISTVPHTLAGGPSTLSAQIQLNAAVGSAGQQTISFEYKVNDGNDDSPTYTASLTITAPLNSEPTANDITGSISAAQQNDTAPGINISQFVSDTNTGDDDLTYYWSNAGGTTDTLFVVDQVKSGTHGEFVYGSNGILTYTYTGNTMSPGDNTKTDTFWYKAEDDDNPALRSGSKSITITITAALNTDPVISFNGSTGQTEVEKQLSQYDTISSSSDNITASDAETTNLTWTAEWVSATNAASQQGTLNINPNTGVWTYNSDQWDISPGQLVQEVFTIKVEDANSGFDTYTLKLNVTGVLYISGITVSSPLWRNTASAACDDNRNVNAYLKASAVTNITSLNAGDSLYSDTTLDDNEVIKNIDPVTADSNPWVSIQQDIAGEVVIRAVKIAANGSIIQVVDCETSLDNAWPIDINFSGDLDEICAEELEYTVSQTAVYQNVIGPTGSGTSVEMDEPTLADVIAAGGQLFTSQYYANQPEYRNNPADVTNTYAPASLCVSPGFYNDGTRKNGNGQFIYYKFTTNAAGQGVWADNLTDPDNPVKLFLCPEPIEYVTFNFKAYYSQDNRLAVDAACLAGEDGLTLVNLWTRIDARYDDMVGGAYYVDLSTHQKALEYVVQNQILIYTTEATASEVNYDGLWDNTTFVAVDETNGAISDPEAGYTPSLRFAIWDNENDSGYLSTENASYTYSWLGINPVTDTLGYANSDSILGDCNTQFVKPSGNSTYCLGLAGDQCEISDADKLLESRINVFYAFYACAAKVEAGKPYYSLYLTDGLHTFASNSSSYIKKLIDVIEPSKHNGTAINIGGDSMLECVTLQHKIFAVNYDDAVNILIDKPEYGDDIRVIEINPVELGFTSGAVIEYREDCASCLLDTQNFTEFILDGIDNADIINRSIPNFDLEKNYELDNISKPLLRTNPKLSTNAKLVVNSLDNMYIESIDASKELAAVEYKKWVVNKDGKWSYDLAKFFNANKTPSDLIYNVKSRFSELTVQESFEKQIEEDYHYGTTYNYSKLHDEDFRMLAPIWLDKNIPSNFVIFRVSDPAAILDFDNQSSFNNMDEILKNSELIKTFDLTRESNIGTYIRNHVKSELFPSNPINVNFSENERSNFNGIDLMQGGFTNKGEYLFDDFVKQDQTIINENDLITGGFERNKLACANLINLEFLFNDDDTEDYAVNRYFGLYVNDVDSGYGSLESANNGLLKFKTLNSYINEDSISAIPPVGLMQSTPTLGYAHISNNFYKISPSFYDTSKLEVQVEDSSNMIPAEIKLANVGRSVDTTKHAAAGSDFIKLTINGAPANNDRIAIFPSKEQDYRINFTRFTPGDTFVLGLTLVETDGNRNYLLTLQNTVQETVEVLKGLGIDDNLYWKADGDDIIFYENKCTLRPLKPTIAPYSGSNTTLARIEYTQVPYDLSNNMFFGSDALLAGGFNTTAFSSNGTNAEIASALTKSINSKDNGFTALTYDGADHLYIKNDVLGYRLMQSGVALPNDNANDWLTIDEDNRLSGEPRNVLRLQLTGNTSEVFKNSKIYFFNGGNSAGKSVLVTLDSVADININDYLETSSQGVYNKVIDIVDDIERLPLQYKKLVLDKKNTIESGEVNVFADNLVTLGLFSAFDIHDMNFDFYDTSNSDLKELKYETAANINYEPELDNQSDIYPFGERENTDYITAPASYFSGLTGVLEDEITDTFNEDFVESEYDRLKENYLKENSIRSRVVPSINKWVLKDTLTVREQPYYLNANEAFGRSNFSADLSVAGRDRLGMTHEWFYINNLPKHLKENTGTSTNPDYKLNESFSYLNFMEGFEMTPAMFKSIDYDYFDRFFVTEGFETKGDNAYKTFVKTNRQKKYTLINGGNDTAFAESIFKGLKVIFKTRKEFTSTSPVDFVKSSEFNGYRFSTVLNVKTSEDSNGIEYEVIQNKQFKFVVFFISLRLDDLWADQTLTRKLLYELNHSLIWNNEEGTFKYSDVKVDGHLDLTGANFSDPNADNYLIVNGLTHADGSVPQFLEQINKNEDDDYGSIIVNINTAFGLQKIQLDISNLGGQAEIILARLPQDITNGTPVETTLDNLPGYLQYNAEYVYKGGGINAYKYILESLGAQDMATMLLRNPDKVTYSTVGLDGTVSLNKFIILLEDGVEFIKQAEVNTEVDDDKPESFKLSSGNIGFNLGLTRTYYPFLIRHNGGYTIDTTPVVTFTDIYAHMKTNTLQNTSNIIELELEEQMYKHSLTSTEDIQLAKDYYKRYNRCGVAFNLGFIYDGGTHDSQWGYIKNHFYRKVNEFKSSGVIKLSVSSDKPPLYPLIGEVAIDKKDVHVFKSSWDKNYYTRALSGGLLEEVPGTFETKEERSYLASTIMKIKDSYTMLNFDVTRVRTEEELDDILANSTNTTDIVQFEDKKRVVLDFYIDFTINKKLSADGVLDTIKKYVLAANSADDKTTLEDDAQLYIGKNLINVFGISQIKLYTQRLKGAGSQVESVDSVGDLDNNNYIYDQNFTFSSHEQKPLNFRLIYNKRLGYSYRIRPMVKITS